jgi:NADPH:quinone reductase-like Zn-dependent oxidoreductase
VWVTSGSEEKLERAISLGAKGGINYKTEKWGKALAKQLGGAKFDLVIDSAGGNIVADVLPVIQQGAPIVSYGMTVAPKITFSMNAILMNIEYRGSTMGSKREFKEMIDFVAKHQIKPIVHKVYQGLEQAEDAFVEMRDGHQFGKIVVQVARSDSSKL